MPEAKSRRKSHALPNLRTKAAKARLAILSQPESVQKIIRPILTAVEEMAREQDDFNRRQWEKDNGLPAEHASTHKGGTDSVAGKGLPIPITLGSSGDRGDPHDGFAPMKHEHGTEALDFLADLADLTTDPIFGAAVVDMKLAKLLEKILLEILKLEAQLAGAQ